MVGVAVAMAANQARKNRVTGRSARGTKRSKNTLDPTEEQFWAARPFSNRPKKGWKKKAPKDMSYPAQVCHAFRRGGTAPKCSLLANLRKDLANLEESCGDLSNICLGMDPGQFTMMSPLIFCRKA